MPLWSLLPTISITKDQVIQEALPAAADAWGDRQIDELEQPKITLRFTAEGLLYSEVMALVTTSRTRNATYTATDMDGETWTGYISSLECTQILGTNRYNASMALLLEDIS